MRCGSGTAARFDMLPGRRSAYPTVLRVLNASKTRLICHTQVQRTYAKKRSASDGGDQGSEEDIAAQDAMPKDALEEWQAITGQDGSKLTSARALHSYSLVDWGHVLGWPPYYPSPPAQYKDYMWAKRQHPTKLVGHRSEGQAIHFVGVDAVIVSELLDSIPSTVTATQSKKEGCPKCSLQSREAAAEVASLCVDHQLELVLFEEVQGQRASGAGPMTVSQICTPHQPFIRGSPASIGASSNGEIIAAGVQWSRAGWTLSCWNLGTRIKWSKHGLPTELLLDQLEALNATPPVYLLDPASGSKEVRKEMKRLERMLRSLSPGTQKTARKVQGTAKNFEAQVEQRLATSYRESSGQSSGDAQAALQWATADHEGQRVVLHSTAYNLGLVGEAASGMPSLVQALAPSIAQNLLGAPSAPKKRIVALLLQPPESHIARTTQQAIRQWWDLDKTETWKRVSSALQLQTLLDLGPSDREDAAAVFSALLDVCRCVIATLGSADEATRHFSESVLRVATSNCGVNRTISPQQLLRDCKEIEHLLKDVVEGGDPRDFEMSAWQYLRAMLPKQMESKSGPSLTTAWTEANLACLDLFFMQYEESKISGIFRTDALSEDTKKRLVDARVGVLSQIRGFFAPEYGFAHKFLGGKVSLRHHQQAETISLYSPKMNTSFLEKYQKDGKPGSQQLVAFDGDLESKSATRTRLFLTKALADAQREYIEAHDEALEVFDAALRKVWEQLTAAREGGSLVLAVMVAKEFTEWGALLTAIAENTHASGWAMPTLAGPGAELQLKGVWPYWMSPGNPECVKNDVCLSDCMAVLSGPNMGGKSTALRSIMAAALLGNAGLPIPAGAGSQVPQYRSFMFRNFRGDSPSEQRSGFALEAKEMAMVLQQGRPYEAASPEPRNFVCIDEFGKGTEDRHATALCAAALLQLDQNDFAGVFATHQHGLFAKRTGLFGAPSGDSEGLLKRTEQWCIQYDSAASSSTVAGTFDSAFKIVPGVNTGSLAFDVAAAQGLPAEMVQASRDWAARVDTLQAMQLDRADKEAATASNGHLDGSVDSSQQPVPATGARTATDSSPESLDSELSSYTASSDVEQEHLASSDECGDRSFTWAAPTVGWGTHNSSSPQELPSAVPKTSPGHELAELLQPSQLRSDHDDSETAASIQLFEGLQAESVASRRRKHAEMGENDVLTIQGMLETAAKELCDGTPVTCSTVQVDKGQGPGIRFRNYSCVYVLQVSKPDGLHYYVGESDNVRNRLARHTKTFPNKHQGHVLTAIIAGLESSEKSSAKKIESSMIRSMLQRGYAMLSVKDMQNKSFGSAL